MIGVCLTDNVVMVSSTYFVLHSIFWEQYFVIIISIVLMLIIVIVIINDYVVTSM